MNIVRRTTSIFKRTMRPKVFCIGANKTGTTTLEKVLADLDYRLPRQGRQEALVVQPLYEGDYRPLRALCKKYDAFQDLPFSAGITYGIVDALFPGSKFILTVRDSQAWFDSLARFDLGGILKKAGVHKLEDFCESTFRDKDVYVAKNYLQNVFKRRVISFASQKIHFDWSLMYDREYQIGLYEQRNRDIVSFFQDRPGQLLILDITAQSDNSKVVEFLNLPERHVAPLPHLNASA